MWQGESPQSRSAVPKAFASSARWHLRLHQHTSAVLKYTEICALVLQAPAALQKLPVRVETLPTNTALPVSAAFIGLSIWTLAQVHIAHHPAKSSTVELLPTSEQGRVLFKQSRCCSPLVECMKQGLADPVGRVSNDAPGLQIALALGASVYLLTDKKRVPRGDCLQAEIYC